MSTYFISSCQKGGIHKFNFDNKMIDYATIDVGNIRGLTQVDCSVFYVKDNFLFKLVKEKIFKVCDLPCHGHDIKYNHFDNTLFFMGTQNKKLYEITIKGKILREIEFDSKYWMNCIEVFNDKIIVFLSCKRPNNESKIILYDKKFNICAEYACPDKDEIHSPFFYNNEIYWCRSNKNLVVKSSLDFSIIKKVVKNNSGYTRGLYVDKKFMILGTSENRHAENSSCVSNINQGCIHTYIDQKIISTFKIDFLEIYDILKYKNVKNYL